MTIVIGSGEAIIMPLVRFRTGVSLDLDGIQRFDVFISHSTRSDLDRRGMVDRLARDLHDRGLSVFLDRLSVRAGDDLFRTLETAIKRSSVGVLVMTAKALDSSWVALEVAEMAKRALEGRMKVVGLRLEPCKPPRALTGLKLLELRRRRDLSRVVSVIIRAVGTSRGRR